MYDYYRLLYGDNDLYVKKEEKSEERKGKNNFIPQPLSAKSNLRAYTCKK